MPYAVTVLRRPSFVQGNLRSSYAGVQTVETATHARRDFRQVAPTTGTIHDNNRVYFKADNAAPEIPFAGAIVRLHRYHGASCAWEGVSDSAGYYHATGLEVGVEYYPVAIDPTRTHQVTAAGPVMAFKAD